ncbi:MAG: AbrB/MazE/SpoVT family DNA-binding domain-containing protein [Desulfurococcales archaeon]|nr:AbrB/MazE/SpoVT family DNA-binding domain-containing protein [Desulfurococcales archaeon]
MSIVVETRVGRKRVIVIPKAIAEAVKIDEGQRIRIMAVGGEIVIKPVRDAVWLALYGRKIGRIMPEEVEEESLREQEELSG